MCWKQMLDILTALLKTPNNSLKGTNIAAAQPPQHGNTCTGDPISLTATYNRLHFMLQLWKGYFQQQDARWVNYGYNKTVFSLSSPTSL